MLNLPFPLAISFFTFQTIAYLVDCYDGNIKKTNLTQYSLFIFFSTINCGSNRKIQLHDESV